MSPSGGRLALIGILAATTGLRLRLLTVPLDRDEGEYAYIGQRILDGDLPYLAVHTMKLPGVPYVYAGLLALLGETEVAIRLGLLALNLASVVLLFVLGRRLLDVTAGVTAAAAYAALSLSQAVDGFTANAEHFVVLPVLAGAILLVPGRPHSRAGRAGAGLLLGIAVLMKQHAAAFVVFGGLWLVWDGWRAGRAHWRRTAADLTAFAAAAALPYAVTCLAMWRAGAFPAFWFWTVRYAREYAGMTALAPALGQLGTTLGDAVAKAPGFWLLAVLGLTTPWWDARARRLAGFGGVFLGCSCAAVSAGLRFSSHYFVLLLPAVSLLAAAAVSAAARAADRLGRFAGPAMRVGLPLLAVAVSLVRERSYLFQLSPAGVARATYGQNPFPEAPEIARYLRAHTRPGERVAVIGSEPEIYFYARRPAATRYIYMYPLMEPHPFARTMQDDLIAELERERPRYLVLVNVDTSWSRRPESSLAVLDWAQRTVETQYRLVGVSEILLDGSSVHHWDEAAAAAVPRSRVYVLTYERLS